MPKDNLGELEHLVLLAAARLGDESYGAAVQKTLEEDAGRRVSIATIYVTLVRLEKKGLVRSQRDDPTPVRGGKAKRVFRLTARGVTALQEARAVLDRMWKSAARLSDFKAR